MEWLQVDVVPTQACLDFSNNRDNTTRSVPNPTPTIKNHSVTLYNDKLYVFGGYDGRKNHNSLRTFNTKTCEWANCTNFESKVPPGRNGHTATLAINKIVVIGGWLGQGPLAADDAWILDLSDEQCLSWSQLDNTGEPPGPCNMHSADYVESKGEVFVFRGGNGREYLNDLHSLNVEAKEWRRVWTQGEPPMERANHSSSVIKDEIFVFGGWNGKERLNDLYILDCITETWSHPLISGPLPHPRAGMSLTSLRGRLYLFGGSGSSSKCFDDLQILDRSELRWLDVEASSTKSEQETAPPPPDSKKGSNPNGDEPSHSIVAYGLAPGRRAGHTATAVDRRIFVFGGSCGSDYLSDFFSLDTDPAPNIFVKDRGCMSRLEMNLRNHYNNEQFSDVTFLVEGKKVFAHRLILASTSDFFKAMFGGQFKESQYEKNSVQSEMEMPDCRYECFTDVLSYVYSGSLPTIFSGGQILSEDSLRKACEILELSDRFMLDHLKQVVEAVLSENVTEETVESLLEFGKGVQAHQLVRFCLHFLRNIAAGGKNPNPT
ncbi:hypothetical protein TrVE_jg10141 [Triparma verrucosa]|uniref:BTB domain-containing protein n=1 Tax=Triparma verrucosa TaxID=1606542 RepID=A0A9W7BU03_9STRA|nr:hypothetical protein TrVE_jg10141 [Triparma verrucosa]